MEEQLPCVIKDKLLSEIKKELSEKANTCRAVLPSSQTVLSVPGEQSSRENVLLQASLLGKLEDAIRQHERACVEKSALEKRLKIKSKQCQKIKDELEAMKGQIEESSDKVTVVQNRITDYESEMNELKAKISELKKKQLKSKEC